MPAPTVTTTGPNGPYNETRRPPRTIVETCMHFQYLVAPPTTAIPIPPSAVPGDANAHLLRELIDVQREQLAYLRAGHEAQNTTAKWQAFLSKWAEEFPGVGEGCQKSFPMIERAFLRLLDDVIHRLTDEDAEGIDDEFSLGEFIDRYGMRLAQLGNVLNILGPLADAARTSGE
jgi:hypothetical protein